VIEYVIQYPRQPAIIKRYGTYHADGEGCDNTISSFRRVEEEHYTFEMVDQFLSKW
jgi:hypothetical protein